MPEFHATPILASFDLRWGWPINLLDERRRVPRHGFEVIPMTLDDQAS
jgi:hypothetical protein